MNTRERYTAIEEHFKNEKNVVALMRTNEWSCYLYDNFDVSASDITEQFWYSEMERRARQGWLKIKSKRRSRLIEQTTDKYDKAEMYDNAKLFEAG
jgi:hypothetical protein